MKAPAFWYQRRGVMSMLLQPAAAIYQWVSRYQKRHAQPYKAAVPMICVGNIVAGGAGKTPVALALADMLQSRGAKPVFVTRGYGGSEAGPLEVDPTRHTASDVGDEALLLACRAPVMIARKRVEAVQLAERQASHIILDDGLQNPTLQPDISFLVVDAVTGLGNGALIPAGPLREPFEDALKRVTAIIVIGETIPPFQRNLAVPIVQAGLEPVLPAGFPRQENFVAFAGIGRPEKFFMTCRQAGLQIVAEKSFPDHHVFKDTELTHLQQLAKRHQAKLLTTEKDWVRLPPEYQAQTLVLPVCLIFDDPTQVAVLLP